MICENQPAIIDFEAARQGVAAALGTLSFEAWPQEASFLGGAIIGSAQGLAIAGQEGDTRAILKRLRSRLVVFSHQVMRLSSEELVRTIGPCSLAAAALISGNDSEAFFLAHKWILGGVGALAGSNEEGNKHRLLCDAVRRNNYLGARAFSSMFGEALSVAESLTALCPVDPAMKSAAPSCARRSL